MGYSRIARLTAVLGPLTVPNIRTFISLSSSNLRMWTRNCFYIRRKDCWEIVRLVFNERIAIGEISLSGCSIFVWINRHYGCLNLLGFFEFQEIG